MINRIIDFSVNNRFIVIAVTVFACLAGWWSMRHLPLDAIPDLSDTQVIIFSRWDRSPDIIEDQVTYPIVTAMVGAPRVRAVRGFSDFGYSYVYVVFEDGTDIYWARSRIQEYLSSVLPRLPDEVRTELGPDATSLGWVYQYALVDESGKHSLADLRSYQDWYLRYHLKSVPGVAEVAPVGGFGKQYQVNVDPNRLQAYGISIRRVADALRTGNREVGGRLVEFGGAEYMIRGRGYVRSVRDIESIVLTASESGTPIRIRDIGTVVLGPDIRRGVAELDGDGEVVSGIVIMRHAQNALEVIDRVKAKIAEIEPGLPDGMKIVPVYDRSDLIMRSIGTLKITVLEIIVTVSIIILLFLWHLPSAVIPIVTIPAAVLISFIPFRMTGLTANIMSLGGIAIAIGALVDAAIVVVEQTHKRLEQWEREGRRGDRHDVIVDAVKQVAGPSFFALLVIAVSFLPVLALEGPEGRLFKPLAYTKNLSMFVAAILAITLDPALRLLIANIRAFDFRPDWLSRLANRALVGTIHREDRHPVSRFLTRIYEPALAWSLRRKGLVIAAALLGLLSIIPVYSRLGSEYMPPLEEGSILYMPTTMPGISIREAGNLLQMTDRIIAQFPEVEQVLGKAGRAETATDPAPLSMLETVIILKPKSEWRRTDTWYSLWAPEWLRSVLRHITPDHISQEELIGQMNDALQIPGLANAWTMPIKGRIDMLSTGMRTPVGLKVSGPDLDTIEEIGAQLESVLMSVPGTRSVFAERTGSGYFLDFEWNLEALARYGLSVEEAQDVVERAIGGGSVTTTVQGRERYPVNVRYKRDFRSDLAALDRVLVPASGGQRQIPLSQLARVKVVNGPSMIRDEDGLLTGYIYVDIADRDQEGFIRRGQGHHPREGHPSPRICRTLERPVRSVAADQGAAHRRHPLHAGRDPDPALHEHALGHQNHDRAPGRSILGDRGLLVHLLPRVQHEHRRLGGAHRPAGGRCRDGHLHAALPGHCLRAGEKRGTSPKPGRSAGSHPPGSRHEAAAEVHDGGHDVPGARTHPVGHGNRGRRHETDRRAHDRRDTYVVPARIAGLPCDLPGLERAHRFEKTTRCRQRDVNNLKREVQWS